MSDSTKGRRVFATRNVALRPYDMDGPVLKPGDWVVYEPGTRHSTRTVTGCLLLGLDWDLPDRR